MARKQYILDEVLKSLRKKKDIRVKPETKDIFMLCDRIYDKKTKTYIINPNRVFDIGNGTLGKIDFLTKVHHYYIIKVDRFKN
jgi:hypothetical protein